MGSDAFRCEMRPIPYCLLSLAYCLPPTQIVFFDYFCSDYFSFQRWMDAFEACGADPAFYACRERGKEERMPWEVIDMGVTRRHLWHEREQAYLAQLSPDCRKQCTGCGALGLMTEGGCCDA